MLALLIGLLSSLIATAQTPLDESYKDGVLDIRVVDPMGRPLHGGISLSVQQVIDGKPKPPFTIESKTTLKYGTYQLAVRGSPGYPVDRIVQITKPYQLVVVTLFLAPIELPSAGNYIKGKLPAKSIAAGCSLVRILSPVSEHDFADAQALDSGEFVFMDIKPGKYLVITVGNEGICEVLQTIVTGDSTQELALH